MSPILSNQYLAGVFDSDGSFSIAKRNIKRCSPSYVAMVQLSWKNTPLSVIFMDALVKEFGGSYMFFGPSKKEYIKFSATGKVAEKIASSTVDFLFLKQEQARNVLMLRTLTVSSGGKLRDSALSSLMESIYVRNLSINTKNKRWK